MFFLDLYRTLLVSLTVQTKCPERISHCPSEMLPTRNKSTIDTRGMPETGWIPALPPVKAWHHVDINACTRQISVILLQGKTKMPKCNYTLDKIALTSLALIQYNGARMVHHPMDNFAVPHYFEWKLIAPYMDYFASQWILNVLTGTGQLAEWLLRITQVQIWCC